MTFRPGADPTTPEGLAMRVNEIERRLRQLESLRAFSHGHGAALEAILFSGNAAIANDVMPPGLRWSEDLILSMIVARVAVAPQGSPLSIRVKQNGTAVHTISIPAGSFGVGDAVSIVVAAGDIFNFDVTAIGSSVSGANCALQLVGTIA